MPTKSRRKSSSSDSSPAAQTGSAQAASQGAARGNAAAAARVRNGGARDRFEAAKQGGGRPLPNQAGLEALFGEDLSDVKIFTGGGAALEALGARAATDGEDIAMGPQANEASLIEEVVHVVQARKSAGAAAGGDGTSSPADSHEREASQVARDVVGGKSVDADAIGGLTGDGAIHRDEAHGALTYEAPTTEIADPNAVQSDLEASPEQKAQELSAAIRGGDMRSVYMLLGGQNDAVKGAYSAFFGRSVASDMKNFLPISNLSHGLSFARFGEASLQSRIQTVTWDILGTDEEKLYGILESASLEDRLAMANNGLILFDILNDTSGAVEERCMQVLRPLMHNSGLSDTAREALFDAVRQTEAELASQVTTLIARLEARKGWLNDDEAGMLTDVADWVAQRGGFPNLDVSAGQPTELMPAVNWLNSELSSREYEQALNSLRTGGQRSVTDKIDEAGSDTTWGISDVDEDGVYAAITAATPQERKDILNDPAQLIHLLAYLDEGSEQDRAMALLRGEGTGDSASAYQDLVGELDSSIWISDVNVFSALERMSVAELVRLRGDSELVAKIEYGISDVSRFRALTGYAAPQKADIGPVVDPGADLEASNERVVARIEHAVDSWDDDEDLAYRAILEWQSAGGTMYVIADASLLKRAQRALLDLDTARRSEIMGALKGERLVTWRDRLESASVGAGTDNTGMDATLAALPDIVLVRDWSNLSDYKALAEAATSEDQCRALTEFIVDIDNDIKFMLSEERPSDWRDLLGDLRGRLITAMRTSSLADMAQREFHYVPRAEVLTRLQYAQARSLADNDRGAGFWNGISMGLNDTWSGAGVATEQAFGNYRTEATEAVAAVDGSAEEQTQITEADSAYQAYLTSHEEYEAAKSSAAAIAGAIVGVIVATIVTIVTAGSAGPACAALLGTMVGAAFTEMTEAAIQGNAYDVEEGVQDLTVAAVTGLITLGMGAVVDKIAKGAAAGARVQAINAALKARFGDTFARYAGTVGVAGLDSALAGFPSNYASDLIRTEGLLRQELGGAGGAIEKTFKDFGTKIVVSGVQHTVNDRTDVLADLRSTGDWDEYSDQLVRKGLIDVGISTVASQLISGTPPSPQDMVKLLCKVAGATSSGRLKATKAEKDVTSTLRFFNEADSETLQTVKFIGEGTASRIIQARGAGGFTSLQDLLAVPRFTERVLTPAATEIRDDYLQKRVTEAAASSTGT